MKSATTSHRAVQRAPARVAAIAPAAALSAIVTLLGACSSGSGGGSTTGGQGTGGGGSGDAQLLRVEYGRLVDVYGLERTSGGLTLALFQSDVVIDTEIDDERPTGSTIPDRDVEFDFLGIDPDSLSSRLFIPREIGTPEFATLFDRLDDGLRGVTAGLFGQNPALTPFSVVPRNAAIKLTFSGDIGVGDEFFVARDANGVVTGVRNTEAIQLLSITGDPTDQDPVGDFERLPARIVPRGNVVVLDPVFLGTEGVQYGVRNNASGMPGSGDQLGANIRLAIALEGPLSIPNVKEPEGSVFVGRNNDGLRAVVRDFRSGNTDDSGADIARGFVRDSEPLRILGAIPFVLERVEPGDELTQVVTVYKNTRRHEIDRGDVLRFVEPNSGVTIFTEVAVKPTDDAGNPAAQFVRVPVRRVDGLQELDPRNLPGFPADTRTPAGQTWLRQNAPRAILIAEFTANRTDPVSGRSVSDDPANFLVFNPEPLPQIAGYDPFPGEPSLPNVNISPFAGAIIRFSKPVDISSVKAFDTFFFTTRDVLDEDLRAQFIQERGFSPDLLPPATLQAKYVTPHLVDSRLFDETGSQTTLRLQPVKGFYLDEEMRRVLPPGFRTIPVQQTNPPIGGPGTPANPHDPLTPDGYLPGVLASTRLPYFLNLVGGLQGIRDLAGNPLDFQSEGSVVEELSIPFFLDGRKRAAGAAGAQNNVFEDNLVVSIVRRFADRDEDPQPSLYQLGSNPNEFRLPLEDMFGALSYTSDGRLVSRPPTRVTKIVDNLNQQPPPQQDTIFRWCPLAFSGEGSRASNSAAVAFGAGIQNPFNPFGARVQMVWREIDMSLSRVDPFDFNLDVEQMYWAPVTTATIFFDIFDEISLRLGHSEYRPEPCVGQFSALPIFPNSGLQNRFDDNYARNQSTTGTGQTIGDRPAPHVAYRGQQFIINPQDAVLEPNGINRFMPLPTFQKPYFVWRDERVEVQGGMTRQGRDIDGTGGTYAPYILSPFLGGQCIPQTGTGATGITTTTAFWDNRLNFHLGTGATQDNFTGGLLASIALPLLADFETECDQPDLPLGDGFVATGFNGWQISLAVTSAPQPGFRVLSGGGGTSRTCYGPDNPARETARGQLAGGGTGSNPPSDNSVYWTLADFLKRQSVATSGFVEILNPHRMPARGPSDFDPRLGPYFATGLPQNVRPNFEWHFEPPLDTLPSGTSVVPEFRAASRVTGDNWAGTGTNRAGSAPGVPNPCFALNPLVAGDAHIKKYDRRPFGGQPRNYWSHFYNEHVTKYTTNVEELLQESFLQQFSGTNANDGLTPDKIVYFNWRFVMVGNTEASPPVAPALESFSMSYRFERTQ